MICTCLVSQCSLRDLWRSSRVPVDVPHHNLPIGVVDLDADVDPDVEVGNVDPDGYATAEVIMAKVENVVGENVPASRFGTGNDILVFHSCKQGWIFSSGCHKMLDRSTLLTGTEKWSLNTGADCCDCLVSHDEVVTTDNNLKRWHIQG